MILFFVFSFFANSTLTEQDVLELVLNQFPTVQMAKNDLEISHAEELRARGAFDLHLQGQFIENTGDYKNRYLQGKIIKPTSLFGLDLYAGYRKSDGSLAIYDKELETLDRGEWSLGVKLPLLRDFLIDDRRAQLKKAKLGIAQKEYQLQAVEFEQIRQALHKYWDWVLAGKKLIIQKNLLSIAEQRDIWLSQRMKAGDIPRFERNDNLRTILQRKSSVMQNELLLTQAIAELGYFLSDSSLTQKLRTPRDLELNILPHLEMSLIQSSTEQLSQKALEQRPDLKSLQLSIEQNKIEETLQKNKFLPQINLQAQFSKDEGLGSYQLDDNNLKTMVSMEIPLQYRALRGRNAQVQTQTLRLNNQKQLLKQRIEADIEIILKNITVSLERRALAQDELSLALNLEKGERQRLRHGESNILTVNLREQASAEAELRLAENTIEVMKHWVTLKTALGERPH